MTGPDLAAHELIEDIYPMSPMQQGLLFHLLRSPGSTEYLNQVSIRLDDTDLHVHALAWQRLADRQPVLRTGFLWEGPDEPLQVVYRDVALPVEWVELRDVPKPERSARIARHLERDRTRGFDADGIPLARLAILQTGERAARVVLTHHVAILDGWSMSLLLDDLAVVEAALLAAAPAPPPAGRPFRDYVAWLRERDTTADERFWRELLAPVTGAAPLPLTGGSGPDASGTGPGAGITAVRMGADATAGVTAVARACAAPLGVLAVAAWALTLNRFGGTDDVVMGLVMSGRDADLDGVDRVIGTLTNTVPIPVHVRSAYTVRDWVAELTARHARILRHGHTPLPMIQRLRPDGAGPLFDTVLVLQNLPGSDSRSQVVTDDAFETTHYPLAVFVVPGDTLTVRVAYQRSMVTADDATLLAQTMCGALAGLAGDLDRTVASVPVLAAVEPVAGATGPVREWPDPPTLWDMVAARVAAAPAAPAVRAAGTVLSYAELDACVGRLARRLVAAGVGPERRVAILLDRSVGSVVAMLATLRAGGAFVPVDPDYPPARRDFMLADSACQVVVTRTDLAPLLPAGAPVRILTVDDDAGDPDDAAPDTPSGRTPHPGNAAYVIYTSGSTGRPKGVVVDHRALRNMLCDLTLRLGGGPGATTVHKVPVSFVDTVFEVLWPLTNGGSVVVVDRDTVRDPVEYLDLLRASRATHTQAVPRQIAAIAELGTGSTGDPLPDLAWAVNAAEPLPASFAAAWDRVCAHARIANIYGMTESAAFATACLLGRGDAEKRGVAPIGRPMSNLVARVLNRELEPCPAGVAGELYLGGVGIARGYFGQPGLTAERFVPDPYGPAGARLYRTGDVVRWLPGGAAAGDLDYVGRADHQVKVRGMRVEPAEVEVAMREHPAVRDVTVTVHDGMLVAYAVAVVGRPLDDVRPWLAERLPQHMVPARIHRLDALPLTAHGKVDRRALPDPLPDRPTAPPVAPRDALEEAIAGVWCRSLGLTSVGVLDDFFDLGGDSLSAIRLVGQVRDVLPVAYTVGELFAAPTVAGAAAAVARLVAADGELRELLAEVEPDPAAPVVGVPEKGSVTGG